jgi:ABC-2 type transport system permease protein
MIADAGATARFEFTRHVLQRRFLVATLGLPLLMVGLVVAALWAADRLGTADLPWAMVGPGEVPGVTLRVASEREAEAAVGRGELAGYIVLRAEGRALARAAKRLPPEIASALHSRAEEHVLAGVPSPVRDVVADPADLLFASVTAPSPPMPSAEVVARSAAAVAVPLLFALSVLFAIGFLVQAVSEEKETRVLEVLVTSVRPRDLIVGKVAGLGLVSLVQTMVWAVLAAAAASRLADRLPIPAPGDVPWSAVLASVPYFILGYLLFATLMVGIGIVVGSAREAQQVAGYVGLFLVAPFMMVSLLIVRPASPAAVILSLFPLTSAVAMPIRLMMSAVPAGTWVLGLVLLGATLALTIWAVGRIFHATMLLAGERPSWSAAIAVLRP